MNSAAKMVAAHFGFAFRHRLPMALLAGISFVLVSSLGAQSCQQISKGEVGTTACLVCHDGQKAPDQSQFRDSAHMAIGCEACHGPGRNHVQAAGRGGLFIVNPGEFTDAEFLQLCGRCHGSETESFAKSVHAEKKAMLCLGCHDIHRVGVTSPSFEDNQLCLECHASSGLGNDKEITAHTYHPVDPENTGASRCATCHMVPLQRTDQGIGSGPHDHSFRPRPPITSNQAVAAGITPAPSNSCAGITGCHDGTVNTAPVFNVDKPSDNTLLQTIYSSRYGS